MNCGKSNFYVGLTSLCLCAYLASAAPGQKADAKAAKDSEPQTRQEKARKNPKKSGDSNKKAIVAKGAAQTDKSDAKQVAAERQAKNAAKKAEKKASPSAEERESAALALVGEHHPELHGLLQRLKSDNPKQYQQAILDLYRASRRLSDRKEKDPARYELELKAWKLDSQVRLLAAKLTMDANPELEDQLKAALREREDVRVGLLELDRTRVAGRLEQLDRELGKRRGHRDDDAQKAFEQLMRRSGKGRPKNKAAKETQAKNKAAKETQAAASSSKQEAPKQDASKQDPAKQEPAKQDPAKQDPVNTNP